jgi:hypothetical protein
MAAIMTTVGTIMLAARPDIDANAGRIDADIATRSAPNVMVRAGVTVPTGWSALARPMIAMGLLYLRFHTSRCRRRGRQWGCICGGAEHNGCGEQRRCQKTLHLMLLSNCPTHQTSRSPTSSEIKTPRRRRNMNISQRVTYMPYAAFAALSPSENAAYAATP